MIKHDLLKKDEQFGAVQRQWEKWPKKTEKSRHLRKNNNPKHGILVNQMDIYAKEKKQHQTMKLNTVIWYLSDKKTTSVGPASVLNLALHPIAEHRQKSSLNFVRIGNIVFAFLNIFYFYLIFIQDFLYLNMIIFESFAMAKSFYVAIYFIR